MDKYDFDKYDFPTLAATCLCCCLLPAAAGWCAPRVDQAPAVAGAPGVAAARDPEAASGMDAALSNWEIMLWTDPLTVSVDTASIAPYSRWLTARVLWDYAEARDGGVTGPYRSMVGIVVVDCATQRLGAAGATSYSGDGGDGDPVAAYSIPPEQAALSESAPGTIGRDLVSYVCAHGPRRTS